MWMVDPSIMCDNHLRGEWRELFAICGTLRLKKTIVGYINNDLLEPLALEQRIEQVRNECVARGVNVKQSPQVPDLGYLPQWQVNHRVNKRNSLIDLFTRCSKCSAKANQVLHELEQQTESVAI